MARRQKKRGAVRSDDASRSQRSKRRIQEQRHRANDSSKDMGSGWRNSRFDDNDDDLDLLDLEDDFDDFDDDRFDDFDDDLDFDDDDPER